MADFKPMTPEEEKVQEDRLIRARIQMMMAFPFFGTLAAWLQLENTYSVATAATDGAKFYYNPYFIKTLNEGELNWVVVHEVLHPALKHLWRKGDRLHKKWNYACDYAIHCIMMQFIDAAKSDAKGKLSMPKGCLYDPKYDNMDAEEIYDLLPQDPKQNAKYGNGAPQQGNGQQQQGGGQQQGTLDDHSMWDSKEAGGAQENGQQKAQAWEGRIVSAAKAAEAKSAGNLPGFLKRLLNKLTKPQKDWRVLLAEFVEPEPADYGFNPPDRRFSDSDFIIPDVTDTEDNVKDILFWIDTSGSIGDRELACAFSEIVGAIGQFQGKLAGYIGFFDHTAYPLQPFESVDDVLKVKPEGGGGTSFHCFFEKTHEEVEKNDRQIAGIIVLTDGYASWPDKSITNGIPVLWLINNEDVTPPWGLHTTIKV